MNDQPTGSSPAPRIYLGNAREKKRRSGETFLIGSMCIDDIIALDPKHIVTARSGKKFFKFIINPYRDGTNEHGNTHSVAVDTHRPEFEIEAGSEVNGNK